MLSYNTTKLLPKVFFSSKQMFTGFSFYTFYSNIFFLVKSTTELGFYSSKVWCITFNFSVSGLIAIC